MLPEGSDLRIKEKRKEGIPGLRPVVSMPIAVLKVDQRI
jgi:hypothetical protein